MTEREKFLEKLKPYMLPVELENVDAAYMFAKYGHRNQYRDGGKERYFEHPRAVANILIDELGITKWQQVVTALLHDILEDSFVVTEHRLNVNFGKKVAFDIKLLTKDISNEEYFERLKKYGGWEVITIKVCDRVHNLRSLQNCTVQKQKRYIKETKEKFYPLLDLLESKLPKSKKKIGEYLREEIEKICNKYK